MDFFQITSVPNKDENDLWFALKGAGSSYGIATEFLYRLHPNPETRAVLVFVFLENPWDFEKLAKLSQTGK